MKNFFFAAALLCAAYTANAQAPARFELTPQGFTDYIVADVPGKSKTDLFKSTADWIAVNYKAPDAVKSKVEGDKITFEGTGKIVSFDGGLKKTHDSRYQIEVALKDGKYKFDLLKLEYYVERNQLGPGGWREINLTDVTNYYTKQGNLRPANKYFTEIVDYFNSLSDELKRFIESGATPTVKKSDW